jgi:hypothetical protein
LTTLANRTPLSQDAVADAFCAHYAGRFRYVLTMRLNKWYVFNSETQCWENDTTYFVRDVIRNFIRDLAPTDDPPLARAMCSADFMLGVEQFASADRRFAITWDQLGIAEPPAAKRRHRAKKVQP